VIKKDLNMKKVFIAALLLLLYSIPALAMQAGTAKRVITPDDWKGRVTVMGNKTYGVLHHIHARALTLHDGEKRMAIVTYDLNCLDVATPILRVRCRDELGIDPAYLVLLATHNHAAPIQIVPDNFDYGRRLADMIFELIEEAIDNERGPARIEFGSGETPWLYSVGDHPVDAEVQVLKVSVEDEVVALLFNQAVHPVQSTFHFVDVGHPGYAVDEVERKMPGTLAMYADACGGNQFSRYGIVALAPPSMVKMIGKKLARVALDVADGPMVDVTGKIDSRIAVIPLPLAEPMSYDDALELVAKKKIPTDIGFVPYPHPDRETNWVRALLNHYEDGIPFPTTTTDRVCTDDAFLVQKLDVPREFPCVYEETIAATIGPMIFVAMQGEVCAPIGRAIKDEFRDERPIMLFAYMGEHNLYIPTKNLVRQKAYQARVIQTQYASPVGWAEEVEEEMVEGVVGLVREVLKGRR